MKVVEGLDAVEERLALLLGENTRDTGRKLWRSMPDRAQEIFEAKGWQARHWRFGVSGGGLDFLPSYG